MMQCSLGFLQRALKGLVFSSISLILVTLLHQFTVKEFIPKADFQPQMSIEERGILLHVFQEFVRACFYHNVTFMLHSGSLLGSYRHHDIIPWDDDIDVLVNASQKELLRSALTSTCLEKCDLFAPSSKKKWKFYWKSSKYLLDKQFRWPYIDIFFFLENKTHIYEEKPMYPTDFAIPKADVFPLRLRPFCGAMLPAPCNTEKVLLRKYSPNLCEPNKFSHKNERNFKAPVAAPCNRLFPRFPFVTSRRIRGDIVHETLTINASELNSIEVASTCTLY